MGWLDTKFLWTHGNNQKKGRGRKSHGKIIAVNGGWSKGAEINQFSKSMVRTEGKREGNWRLCKL